MRGRAGTTASANILKKLSDNTYTMQSIFSIFVQESREILLQCAVGIKKSQKDSLYFSSLKKLPGEQQEQEHGEVLRDLSS